MKKWVIWVPWLKKFFTKEGGEILFFDDETVAKKWADEANALVTPGPARKDQSYVAVPWDEQAQSLASGGLP